MFFDEAEKIHNMTCQNGNPAKVQVSPSFVEDPMIGNARWQFAGDP